VPGLRLGIERVDAFDEVRAVGEIEIVHALRNAGADHAVGIAIDLKRARRIDHDIGRGPGQLQRDVAFPVERQGRCLDLAAEAATELFGLGTRTARDDEMQPRLIRQQLRETTAECAVATEDQDLEGRRHWRIRPRKTLKKSG
jgi:hypothetical protein